MMESGELNNTKLNEGMLLMTTMLYKKRPVKIVGEFNALSTFTAVMEDDREFNVRTGDLSHIPTKVKKLTLREKILDVMEKANGAPLTIDAITVELDRQYSRLQPGDKNSIAPYFSVGSGMSLYDQEEVVKVGIGTTRPGKQAQAWVLKRFATEPQIEKAREGYLTDLRRHLQSLEEKLRDIPKEIEDAKGRIEYIKTLVEGALANNN